MKLFNVVKILIESSVKGDGEAYHQQKDDTSFTLFFCFTLMSREATPQSHHFLHPPRHVYSSACICIYWQIPLHTMFQDLARSSFTGAFFISIFITSHPSIISYISQAMPYSTSRYKLRYCNGWICKKGIKLEVEEGWFSLTHTLLYTPQSVKGVWERLCKIVYKWWEKTLQYTSFFAAVFWINYNLYCLNHVPNGK